MIRHYYHVYADGQWNVPVVEHIHALRSITNPMQITVGLVGSKTNRDLVKVHFPDTRVVRWIESDSGWEQTTLAVIRSDAHATSEDYPVLYAHTKGSGDPSPINVAWRMSMTRHCVGRWRACLHALLSHDAVGCHWLTKDIFPSVIENPIFGGNFWWANSGYLRRLPELEYANRWDAEKWVGLASPMVHDLLPGWPGFNLFDASAS